SNRTTRSARLSPSSARLSIRIRLTRTNAVSDSASTAENANNTMITARAAACPFTVASGPLLHLAESHQELLLAPAHHDRLAGFGVVVVQQVQHTVDHEQRKLVVGRHVALGSLPAGDRRAHDD